MINPCGLRCLFPTALVVAALCQASGCGKVDGPSRAAVHGTVTLDGEPVEQGTIEFFPVNDTTGPVVGAEIRAGRYALSRREGPAVGTNRIEISWPRTTGNTATMPADGLGASELNEPERTEAIPPQYNRQSTLTRTIEAGDNPLSFELRSTP